MSVNSFKELKKHVGHKIKCVAYGTPTLNTAIECGDCELVLMDYNKKETKQTKSKFSCGCNKARIEDRCKICMHIHYASLNEGHHHKHGYHFQEPAKYSIEMRKKGLI